MIATARKLDYATGGRAAEGRWLEILAGFGIDLAYLRNQHGPCPRCGGKDCFRFDDKNGRGTFYCNRGTTKSGDGFDLLVHVFGWTHTEALHRVAAFLNIAGGASVAATPIVAPAPALAVDNVAKVKNERQKLIRIISESEPILNSSRSVAFQYLAGRSLQFSGDPRALRYHPSLPYYHHIDGRPVLLGKFPAMVGVVTSFGGELVGLHRTYLTPDGKKALINHPQTGEQLPIKKLQSIATGATSGAAIQLHEAIDRIAIAEGVETSIAVHQLTGWPVWAAISANGLEKIRLPENIKDVLIFADHDISGVGESSAHALVKRLASEGRTARIRLPDRPGDDWADVVARNVK